MNVTEMALARSALRKQFMQILQSVARDDIPLDELDDDRPLREQVEIDSMDLLDFAIEVRKNMGIELPDEAIAKFSTIREWLDFASREILNRRKQPTPLE